MYQHILIATDGSELAGKAIDQGLVIAKGLGARVSVVSVTERPAAAPGDLGIGMGIAFPSEEFEREAVRNGTAILDKAAAAAGAAGVPCQTLLVKSKPPAAAIIEAATTQGCDLIVMASHGRRGLSRVLLGSQTSYVLSHTTLPVLVIR